MLCTTRLLYTVCATAVSAFDDDNPLRMNCVLLVRTSQKGNSHRYRQIPQSKREMRSCLLVRVRNKPLGLLLLDCFMVHPSRVKCLPKPVTPTVRPDPSVQRIPPRCSAVPINCPTHRHPARPSGPNQVSPSSPAISFPSARFPFPFLAAFRTVRARRICA